ncbi:alpha/beta hydrolase [Neobacillus niacini]|uniref:alpha/beta hydrolase n=1 Tax=Neobacillus niacini TaxID=86668 RepID=UPI0021CAF285|nr:alpha/beta hydrolase [Neobacillus niacini]MCM3768070.1 alpha/beta hydrolase [Neobacillus niacini]
MKWLGYKGARYVGFFFLLLLAFTASFTQYTSGQDLNQKNMKYGSDVKQALDLYVPKNNRDNPVIIYVHGGGWMRGDKADVGDKPAFFTDKGYVFVSVNYRLFPNAAYEEMATDVATAVKWVFDHAEQYQIDIRRINLMGHSAGGHLVSLIGTNQNYLEQAGLPPGTIHSIVNLDGPIDLAEFLQRNSKYKTVFGEDDQVWTKASPITYATEQNSPPILLVSPKRPSISSFIERTGDKATTFEIHSLSHGEIKKLLGSGNAPEEAKNMTKAVADFLHNVNF